MGTLKHNWLAIIITSVLAQGIAAGIYGSISEQWMEWNHLTLEMIEADQSPLPFIVSFVNTFIMVFCLSLVFKKIGVHSLTDGLKWGAIIGFGFAFLGRYTQGHFQYNITAGLVDATNLFLAVLLAGLILGAWRRYENA